ncbi:MAG: hypothetical protein SGPRY_011779, partial [Prymnesium sp.]
MPPAMHEKYSIQSDSTRQQFRAELIPQGSRAPSSEQGLTGLQPRPTSASSMVPTPTNRDGAILQTDAPSRTIALPNSSTTSAGQSHTAPQDEQSPTASQWGPGALAVAKFAISGVALALLAWTLHWWNAYGKHYRQGRMRVPKPTHEGKYADSEGHPNSDSSTDVVPEDEPELSRSFEHVRGTSARGGVEYDPSVGGCAVLYTEAETLHRSSPTNMEHMGSAPFEPPMMGVVPGNASMVMGGMHAPTPMLAHCKPIGGIGEATQLAQSNTILRVEMSELGVSLPVACAGVSDALEVQQRVHQVGCSMLGPDCMPKTPEQLAISYIDAVGQWAPLPNERPHLCGALDRGVLHARFLLEPQQATLDKKQLESTPAVERQLSVPKERESTANGATM